MMKHLYRYYQISDTSCQQPTVFDSYRNNYCLGYKNGYYSQYDEGYLYNYPVSGSYYSNDYYHNYGDAVTTCSTVPTATASLPITCNGTAESNFYFSFISKSNPPTTSFLTFTSNITLTGLTTTSINLATQWAINNATAHSMNLPMSDVYYEGSHAPPALAPSPTVMQVERIWTAVTYTWVVTTITSVPITSESDSNTIYSQYTNALITAVLNGQYSSYLAKASKAYGTTTTATATATAVTNSPPMMLSTPAYFGSDDVISSSSSSDDDFSSGVIAGLVVGGVVGVGLVIALAWYLVFVVMKPPAPLAKQVMENPIRAAL
jgi:hypothetical protein